MGLKQLKETLPLVSVVIPTHNCLKYLKTAIDSVLSQNYEELEIIVIDDNSSDGTYNWLCAERLIEPRIKPFKIQGTGVSQVRNYAIEHCQGEYVAFLDADDIWRSNKLKRQIDFHIANPDVVLSFTNYEHFDMQGNTLGDCFSYWPHFQKLTKKQLGLFSRIDKHPTAPIFAENVIGTSSVIVKKNALQIAKGFDTTLISASDWDLWLRISEIGPIGFSSEIMMDYLVRNDSISRKTELRLQQMQKIIKRYEKSLKAVAPLSVFHAHARLFTGWAEHYRIEGKLWHALSAHLRALLISPSKRLVRATLSDMLSISRLSVKK